MAPPPPHLHPNSEKGTRNVFTASLKYNCLYKRAASLSAAPDCFPPFQQIYYFLSLPEPERVLGLRGAADGRRRLGGGIARPPSTSEGTKRGTGSWHLKSDEPRACTRAERGGVGVPLIGGGRKKKAASALPSPQMHARYCFQTRKPTSAFRWNVLEGQKRLHKEHLETWFFLFFQDLDPFLYFFQVFLSG